jgi:hypothetical protein
VRTGAHLHILMSKTNACFSAFRVPCLLASGRQTTNNDNESLRAREKSALMLSAQMDFYNSDVDGVLLLPFPALLLFKCSSTLLMKKVLAQGYRVLARSDVQYEFFKIENLL